MLIIGVFKGLHIPTSWREWGIYILLGAYRNFLIKSFLMKDFCTIPAATSKYYYGFDTHDDSAFSVGGL